MNNDICRCHDAGCDERENCQRWINRNDMENNIPHSPSLFPYDIPLGDPCYAIIEKVKEKKE
jgi:hypothetical protein